MKRLTVSDLSEESERKKARLTTSATNIVSERLYSVKETANFVAEEEYNSISLLSDEDDDLAEQYPLKHEIAESLRSTKPTFHSISLNQPPTLLQTLPAYKNQSFEETIDQQRAEITLQHRSSPTLAHPPDQVLQTPTTNLFSAHSRSPSVPLRLGNSILGRKSMASLDTTPRTNHSHVTKLNNPPIQSEQDEEGLFVERSEAVDLQVPSAELQSDAAEHVTGPDHGGPVFDGDNMSASGLLTHAGSPNGAETHASSSSQDRVVAQSPANTNVPAIFGSSHKLNQIVTTDLLVMSWRDLGHDWQRVTTDLCEATGSSRNETTIRSRANLVNKAFAMTTISQTLISQASSGDLEALKEINLIVKDKVGTSMDRNEQNARSKKQQPASVKENAKLSTANGSRPLLSGKQPTWDLLDMIVQGMQDNVSDNGSVAHTEEENNTSDVDDYVHYTFQVQRRECSTQQVIAEGLSVEEVPWQDMDEPYTSSAKANRVACGKVLLLRCGSQPIINGLHANTIRNQTDEHGLMSCEYSSEAGCVQTRVKRRLRTFSEHIKVHDRSEWHPRTIFAVKQRVTVSSTADPLFGDQLSVEVKEELVGAKVCADLAWVNEQAIEHFVGSTYTPKSMNLNARDLEISALKQGHSDRLSAEGDGVLFEAESTTSKGSIEVWVERMKLVGPRNL